MSETGVGSVKRAPLCENLNLHRAKSGSHIAVPGKSPMTFQHRPGIGMRSPVGLILATGLAPAGIAVLATGAGSLKRAPLCGNLNLRRAKSGSHIAVPGKSPATFQHHPTLFMRRLVGPASATGLAMTRTGVGSVKRAPLCGNSNSARTMSGYHIAVPGKSPATFQHHPTLFMRSPAGPASATGLATAGVGSLKRAPLCGNSNSARPKSGRILPFWEKARRHSSITRSCLCEDWLGWRRRLAWNRSVYRQLAWVHQGARLRAETQTQLGRRVESILPFREKADDIPASPEAVYAKTGWAGFGDWLGTGRRRHRVGNWRGFSEARAFVQKLKLNSANKEWVAYCRSGKSDIPASPDTIYAKSGWAGFGDWLGNGRRRRRVGNWRGFIEARAFVRKRKLSSTKEWKAYCHSRKMPDDIPASPHTVYSKSGWVGIGDWLGTDWRPFDEARTFARILGLKSCNAWLREYARSGKKPNDIPARPNEAYADHWVDWNDWLGRTVSGSQGRKN